MHMESDIEARLKAIENTVDDTHALVKQMRRVQRNANLTRMVYRIVWVIAAVRAYYAVQPYLMQLRSLSKLIGV